MGKPSKTKQPWHKESRNGIWILVSATESRHPESRSDPETTQPTCATVFKLFTSAYSKINIFTGT